jgi:hypothetical protein
MLNFGGPRASLSVRDITQEEDAGQHQIEGRVEVSDGARVVGLDGHQQAPDRGQKREPDDNADSPVDEIADRQAIALIYDLLAVDQRKSPQRREGALTLDAAGTRGGRTIVELSLICYFDMGSRTVWVTRPLWRRRARGH